jgi:hypothetical protein
VVLDLVDQIKHVTRVHIGKEHLLAHQASRDLEAAEASRDLGIGLVLLEEELVAVADSVSEVPNELEDSSTVKVPVVIEDCGN